MSRPPHDPAPVGILGGAFDPPHRAHLALARAALDGGHVRRVLLVPTGTPPHKHRPDLTPAALRLAMAHLLAEEDARLDVSGIEVNREGTSYTVETVQALLAEDPATPLRLLIGADQAAEFHHWREAPTLLRLAPPLIAERPGERLPEAIVPPPPEGLDAESRRILRAGRLLEVDLAISSTGIREAIRDGEDPSPLLTPSVHRFIREHDLYR